MPVFHTLINTILVIVFIYARALFLRREGTLTEEHSLTLARIVTDLYLPVIIFVSLANQSIRLDQIAPALVMLGLALFCIALAWIVSVLLKFNKAQQTGRNRFLLGISR
jgi:predicted permease